MAPLTGCLVSLPLTGPSKAIIALLERIQPADGAGKNDPEEQVEGESHFDEVLKFVTARIVHVSVGLVADGGGDCLLYTSPSPRDCS